MNAGKANFKKEVVVTTPTFENHLRVLSKRQRKQVSLITKDWQRFTISVYTEMFDKI